MWFETEYAVSGYFTVGNSQNRYTHFIKFTTKKSVGFTLPDYANIKLINLKTASLVGSSRN